MKRKIRNILIVLMTASMILSGCTSHKVVSERENYGKKYMVSAANKEASEIGAQILRDGGNAIDAAVAVGFALGVLEPNASGIGGGGFLLYKPNEGEAVFIDFREVAPIKGTLDQYQLDESGKVKFAEDKIGSKSIAVPGEVKGLLRALEDYGTKSREEVMAPAIKLAREGVVVTENLSSNIQNSFDVIGLCDATYNTFTKDAFPLQTGELLINKDLADTLEFIMQNGEQGFYNSQLTKAVVEELNRLGSYITVEDFQKYEVQILKPIMGNYRGYDIISSPPPSSGGTHVIEILNMLESFDVSELKFGSAENIHLWSEIYKRAYQDRDAYMGDPNFVKVPVLGLTSKAYAEKRIENFNSEVSSDDESLIDPWIYESGSTTHYSIIDQEGNMVAVTKTINHFFGSGISAKGVLFNDQIADLSFDKESPNFIQPLKKPLSSMSPTILLKNGKPYATLGTPGGVRIISTIPWIVSNLVDHNMNLQQAIEAPRIAQYAVGELFIEGGFDAQEVEKLKAMGHKVAIKKELDLFFGGAQGIVILPDGYYHGAADPRRDGFAVGE